MRQSKDVQGRIRRKARDQSKAARLAAAVIGEGPLVDRTCLLNLAVFTIRSAENCYRPKPVERIALDLYELDLLRHGALPDERDVVVRLAPDFEERLLFEQVDQVTGCDVILNANPTRAATPPLSSGGMEWMEVTGVPTGMVPTAAGQIKACRTRWGSAICSAQRPSLPAGHLA
jgi:hypothetical protein